MAISSAIPVVPGLPIVGHLLSFRNERLELQARVARQHGDLVRLRFGLFTLLMASSAEIAHEVLVEQSDAFVKSPGLSIFAKPILGEGLITSEHEHHRRQRGMIAPAFAQKRIAQYADVMVQRAEQLQARLQALGEGEAIDVSEQMMRLTLEIVGKTLFDAEVGTDAEQVGRAVAEAMEYVVTSSTSFVPIPPSLPTQRNRRLRRTIAKLDEIIFRLIRERREEGQDRGDLLSMLIAARDEEDSARHMDDRQVRDEAMTLFLAGHETTANALAWSYYLLAQHPAAYDRLLEEVDTVLGDRAPSFADLPKLPYTLATLKEAMRLYPPVPTLARRAVRSVPLGGHPCPRHTIVVLNVYGMHRRADYFPCPERFDPSRFLGDVEKRLPRGAYLPFGAGPRLCIGKQFALMEGALVLATLGRRVRFELVPGQRVVPQPLMTLRPQGGIRMRVRRRP